MKRSSQLGMCCLLASLFFVLACCDSGCENPREEWRVFYDGPAHGVDHGDLVVLDGTSHVYVAGGSQNEGTGLDIFTVKYDAKGQELWSARYSGPGKMYNTPSDMALDSEGNVHVTGLCYAGRDSNEDDNDFITLKYDTNGKELWARLFNGPANHNDRAFALAIDRENNVYTAGVSSSGTHFDLVTIKYDKEGKQRWVKIYDGPDKLTEIGTDIAVDSEGNIVVAGCSDSIETSRDILLIKYDPEGDKLWQTVYNGPDNLRDAPPPWTLALDREDNIFVAAYSQSAVGGSDFLTLKFDSSGELVWADIYNSQKNYEDRPKGIALDRSGNIYVAGDSLVGRPTASDGYWFQDYDCVLIKYSPEGTKLWESSYNGPVDSWDTPRAIVVDGKDNVYLAAWSVNGVDSGPDMAVLKYDPVGNLIWTAVCDSSFNDGDAFYDGANDVAVDSRGNVYVTGYFWGGLETKRDFIAVKYSQKRR